MNNPANFKAYLSCLGFPTSLVREVNDSFTFPIDLKPKFATHQTKIKIEFIYTNDKEIGSKQLSYWNRNDLEILIAVTDEKTHVIDPKVKPKLSQDDTLKAATIMNFDYGVNSQFDPVQLKGIRREDIDTTEFFQEIYARKKSVRNNVSNDLLLNLIALRNDLANKKNQHEINVLLLRCLFIKYLEDRKIIEEENFLVNQLRTQSPQNLLRAFGRIRKINGDLFKKSQLDESLIKSHHLAKLQKFFSCYNYVSGQGTLFPYQFDKIPVEIISNIYEAFLKDDERKENSVYYTPEVLVKFMIEQALEPCLKKDASCKILDPACGSGSYLVEAYKRIITANEAHKSFNKKVEILQDQIFGIDVDESALVIAAFSLYLTLLEDINPKFIRNKIEKQHPLLPSLLSKNLIRANALVDDISFQKDGLFNKQEGFDCIIANPPWGSAEKGPMENNRVREAIGEGSKKGTVKEYESVSDFQKSQAFLLRAAKWSHSETRISFVVNNSIFFNEKAAAFRAQLLNIYTLESFYECSEINKILFRQHNLGKLNDHVITVGANEPCAVLMMKVQPSNEKHTIQYITPRLTSLSEHFNLIHFSDIDIKTIYQDDLKEEDKLWRVFVHGDWKSYQLINHCCNIFKNNLIKIECDTGFQPKSGMKSLGKPLYRTLIEPPNITRYCIHKSEKRFNWNQELHRERDENIFKGERILFPIRPLEKDNYKLRAALITDDNSVYKDNISVIKFKHDEHSLSHLPYLAILNSSLIGFLIYHLSSQWGKGDLKRSTLRNSDIESLPIPHLSEGSTIHNRLSELAGEIMRIKSANPESDVEELEHQIDETVFKLYKLKDYDKEVIREFYQIKVRRKDNPEVTDEDLNIFTARFKKVFSFVLDEGLFLNASFDKFHHLAIVLKFEVVPKEKVRVRVSKEQIDFIAAIKQKQMTNALRKGLLNEQKIKIYGNDCFYLIKPNHIAYWTIKQAIDDANEEIGEITKSLPAN